MYKAFGGVNRFRLSGLVVGIVGPSAISFLNNSISKFELYAPKILAAEILSQNKNKLVLRKGPDACEPPRKKQK